MIGIHRISANLRARRAGRGPARPPTRHRGRRPWTVEALEDRTLLATFTVNSLGDAGAGSGTAGDLRYVITQADQTAGDNTIDFAVTGTITLNSALPDLSNTTGLTDIEGPGAASLTVARSNAQGTPPFRIFTVDPNVTASLAGLTISGGLTYVQGGGIDNSGTLTVTGSTIDHNVSEHGGGIYNGGTMTVTNSTIADNEAGGLSNFGGGIDNSGTMTVINSTIADNYAFGGGTVSRGQGGGIDNSGTMTVTNSTIADNEAADNGGGIESLGAMTVTNSTIADNSVGINGGVGGGFFNHGTVLYNTIVAMNTGFGATASDIAGSVSSSSASNLIGTGGSGGLTDGTNGNQVGVADPGLGPVAYNGGPTQTIALLAGSPAIDAGSNALAVDPEGNPLTTDQRGPGFPRIVNGMVDIGAFEFDAGTLLVMTAQPPAGVTAGAGFGLTVAAEDGSGAVDTSFDGTVTVALSKNSGGATLGGTLSVTAQSGVATFSGLTLDKAGTGYILLVSGYVLSSATTNAISVTPAAASQLVLSAQPPGSFAAGSGFGLTATAEDPFGNVDTNFGGSVAVALLSNPGGATLGGTLSVAAQSGLATFTGLTVDQPGIGYTLQVTSNGLTAAATGAFNVYLPNVPTVYTVDLTSADGTGSEGAGDLVYAIGLADANANPAGSEIQFDPTVFASPQTIALSRTLMLSESAGPVVIDGPGANVVTISGGNAVRVFLVFSNANVTDSLTGLTISGGLDEYGSGIYNVGTLTVTDCTIADNSAEFGSGIDNGGTLTVTDSNLSYNSGGGIYNSGTMTVTDSSIDNNSARPGPNGEILGGGIENSRTMTVTGSTIANNSANGVGGGIYNEYYPYGVLTVTNSTIANNSAVSGGGIDSGGTLTVTDSTIADNSADEGGGILSIAGGTVTLDNTIVALNTSSSGATPDDIAGSVSSASAYNLIGTGGSGGLVNGTDGNQVGVADPGLGPLAYYGGPTQTIDLLPGSPAIDLGSNALAVDPTAGLPLTTDQRGSGFLRIVNGTVDIGAYEVQSSIAAVAVGWGTQTAALQTAADGLRLLPAGRSTDLPWLAIDQVQLTLTQAEPLSAADVTISSAIGVNYGPVTVSGSGTSYTITLAQPIDAADRVTITIVNPGISLFNGRLDVLPGDFNDDGVVNSQDVVGVRNEMLGLAPVTIFGDLDGDGKVDINDYNAVRQRIGTTLPPLT